MLSLACGGDEENIFHVDIVSTLTGGRDIEMVSMPGGTYAMGSDLYPVMFIDTTNYNPEVGELIVDTTYNTERPVHFAQLPSFLISSTEITQEQYVAVMGVNPSHFRGEANLPVENVTWFDAAMFCNELSKLLGYQPCYDVDFKCDYTVNGFRLPTEAEWEYAARAGTGTEYSNGNEISDLELIGWYMGNYVYDSKLGIWYYTGNSEGNTHAAANKIPNPAGLYDMHGNVSEWCQDYFDYYNCGSQIDPSGPELGALRITRGGSWADKARDCRSAARRPLFQNTKYSIVGFRIERRN